MNRCGLLTVKHEPVPLKSVEVEVQVRDHVATVVSTLNYENKEDKPLEAVFVFPLPGDAAVCHFSAKMGQTEIVAEVKEKQKAREEYDDALSSGQQAFLLEESEQSPDIFSMSVGCLPPGESASIRLEYVTELSVQADSGLRFCLPAVLNPRYKPRKSIKYKRRWGRGNIKVTSVPASMVPYSMSFCAKVASPRPVSKIESSCTLGPLQYLNTEQTQAMIKLAARHKFDRDVELLIYYKDAHQPTAVVERGKPSAKPGTLMGDPAVMLSLYPEFPQAVMSKISSCGEFVCLLDRSGSMDEAMNKKKHRRTRISSAKGSLLLLLKSLPMGCYFNIYSFGSSFEHIFPKSVEYSQKTMEEALKKVGEMEADLGGTEILRPLEHIFSHPCIQNHPRQLFVFTDGEVGNTKQVIDLVKKNSHLHRCFSFGIGEGASSALVNGLAKEGGGHAQFITGTDKMQPKVMQSLRYALQPVVVDVSVTWDLPQDVSASVLSPPITALFHGQRSLIYAQLTGKMSKAAEGCVTVKYSLAGHPNHNQLKFSLKPTEDTGLTVHRLAARALIRSMEMEERESKNQQDESVKEKVVELSVQSGVSSAFTAFVAVSKDNGEAIQGPLVRRNVPTPRFTVSCLATSPPRKSRGFSMAASLMRAADPRRMIGKAKSPKPAPPMFRACPRPVARMCSAFPSDYNPLFVRRSQEYTALPLRRSRESSAPVIQYSLDRGLDDADSFEEICTGRCDPGYTAVMSGELYQAPVDRDLDETDYLPKHELARRSDSDSSDSEDSYQNQAYTNCDLDESESLSRQDDLGSSQAMPPPDSQESPAPVILTSMDGGLDKTESTSGRDDLGSPQAMPSPDSQESPAPVILGSPQAMPSPDSQESAAPVILTSMDDGLDETDSLSGRDDLGSPQAMPSPDSQESPAPVIPKSSERNERSGGIFGFFMRLKKSAQAESLPDEPPMDPFLQLVSLQKASGCWDLTPALAAAVRKTSQELEKMKPASAEQEVWATVLSLIWLHGFKKDVKEEWELLAMKAVSWLGQNASCVEECMKAANALLGCKVKKHALGL